MNDDYADGFLQVGKTYYFMLHVYHHFIGTVVAITGRKECIITKVRRIQSCQRGWNEFFADGAKSDTNFSCWTDGQISNWMGAWLWPHPIPSDKNEQAAQRKR